MPCINLGGAILCCAGVYEYKGWTFEFHPYCGPWPLKKDGELRKRAGRKFYKMIEEWQKEQNESN